jgi:hypothetical protein
MNFNITDQDRTAPRVIEAGFVYDKKSSDPNYLTFYAKVYENGSGIEDVIVYYYFLEAENVGIETSLTQKENHAQMELVNLTYPLYEYTATVPFKSNKTSWKVIYSIYIADRAGNAINAYDVLRDYPDNIERDIIVYIPSGLLEMRYVILLVIVFLFVGTVITVNYIHKKK